MKNILVINPGSTSTKIAFYHDGEQVWKESIDHDAAEIKKYAAIYDQKDMRTKLVRDALAAHGEKVTELDGVVASLCDTGERFLAKLDIGADLRLFLGHADVRFVNEGVASRHLECRVEPAIGGCWIPDLR